MTSIINCSLFSFYKNSYILNRLKIKKKENAIIDENDIYLSESHTISPRLSATFSQYRTFSFSFSIYIEKKKEKISQGAEYCTSRKKEHSKLKHHI